MGDAEHNPYESPKALPRQDGEASGRNAEWKPTPEEKRRWRRAVVPSILFSLATGFCASLAVDVETGLTGLSIAALAIPAIVGYWLVFSATGRRRVADVAFAVWTAGWLAPCIYVWLRFQFVRSDHPVDLIALFTAFVVSTSHLAAYSGVRIGTRRWH